MKHVVQKCEDKMDKYVASHEAHHGTIPIFNCKMHVDSPQNNIVNDNLSLLCDLEPILGLHTILPLLDYVHVLNKLAQSWDIFMCDFIDTMNIFQL
jgi:hypothetical protein